MNCKNCGAPVKPVRGQEYFYCDYCEAVLLLTPTDEGIKVIGTPSDMECPVCKKELVLARLEGSEIFYCTKCHGYLCPQFSFGVIVETRRSLRDTPKFLPKPLDPQSYKRKLNCPKCNQVMATHPYFGPGPVMIDTCPNCKWIWIDHGELKIMAKPVIRFNEAMGRILKPAT